MAAPRASRARHAFFAVLAALVAVSLASDAAVAQEQLDGAAAARALLQAPAPAAPAVKYCAHASHEKRHHHHLGDNSEAPVSTTTTTTSTDVPGPDDPDCVQPPPWHHVDTSGSGEGQGSEYGSAPAPAPSGHRTSSEGSGEGSGTETSEAHWPNGGPKAAPAPAPGSARSSDYGEGSGEGGNGDYSGGSSGGVPGPPQYAVVSTDHGQKLLVPTDELVHQTPVVTPTDVTHDERALGPSVNEHLMFTSTEQSTPGQPPSPNAVADKEASLSPTQQAQLDELVKADPNAVGWCAMCPGQVMPPLPPVAFTCPACPAGQTCGPCKAGDAIDPAATMYIALGAPASCPACPNGEPTKQDVQEQHVDDKKQLPADEGSASTLAQQNGKNVTVHIKHHWKPHRHGGYSTEENITYTSDGSPPPTEQTTTSTTSESTTTTTTTSSTSTTEADYDYSVYDYTTTTTDASGGRFHHGHKIKVPLPAVQGEKKTHHHVGAPPHTSTSPLPGGGTEKKTRIPGVPPGQAVIGTTPVTVSDINTDLTDIHDHISAGGNPTSDMGLDPVQIADIGDVVAKNPSIVNWCPVCAGQSAPPLLPIQYPCPACPAGQICGSCVPGDDKDSSDATMFLNIGTCPSCPAHDTKADWHSKHNGTVRSHATHQHNAEKISTGNHKKVVVKTKHHHHPGTDNVTTTTTTSTDLPFGKPIVRDYPIIKTSSSTETFHTSTESVASPPPPHPALQILGAPPDGITVVKVTPDSGLTPAPGGALKLAPGEGGNAPATTVTVVTLPNGTVIYELPAGGHNHYKYTPKSHPPPHVHTPPHAHPPPRAYHYVPNSSPGMPPRRVPIVQTPVQVETPNGGETPVTGPHAAAQFANTAYWSTTTTTTDTATAGAQASNFHPAPPSSGRWCSICLDKAPPVLPVSANISCPRCPEGEICGACPAGSYVGAGRRSRSLLGLSLPTWLGGKPAAASDEAGGDISNYVVGVTSTLPRNVGGPTMYLSATSCTPCTSSSRR